MPVTNVRQDIVNDDLDTIDPTMCNAYYVASFK